MAGGSLNLRSSNFSDTENDDESIEPDFANARVDPEGTTPNENRSWSVHCLADYISNVIYQLSTFPNPISRFVIIESR